MKDKKIVVLCTSRIYDPQVHDYIELINDDLRTDCHEMMIFTINSDLYWDESNISAETSVYNIIPYESADVLVIMDEKIKCHSVSQKIIRRLMNASVLYPETMVISQVFCLPAEALMNTRNWSRRYR